MGEETDNVEDQLKRMFGMDAPEENEYARRIREINEKIQSKK